jgi:hypothetical protein
VCHHLSGRMYRFRDVGMLLLGSLLGLASPSLAQPIPGAIPGSGSAVMPPSVPGSTPPSSVLGSTPHASGQPGTYQGITPRAFTDHTTSQPPPAPSAPGPGDAVTAPAPPPPAREEISPIERLVAGNTREPHALLRQFGYDLFTRYQQPLRQSPMCLLVPITSSGQGII